MSDAKTIFIGGGNMARAIISGLIQAGNAPGSIEVQEPDAATAEALVRDFGVHAAARISASASPDSCVVWAVKPQVLKEVMQSLQPELASCLHLSIAAGVTIGSMQQWLGTQRIVRAMPNTPALVAQGMTGLYAAAAVSAGDRETVERIAQAVGKVEWLQSEDQLNAVTALSGSGPAYVFYFLEAMQQAGVELGLPADQAYRLAIQTFSGAAALAAQKFEPPEQLRKRVTSKGGTTYEAILSMQEQEVQARFVKAMHACHARAEAMAREFG